MLKVLLVGMGGFAGSVCRYLASGLVQGICEKPWFPYGTLAVNVIGCFLIGLLGGLAENRQLFNPEVRLFLMVGFLGGFTTFSTFGYEVLAVARDGDVIAAFANLTGHLILGFGAVWIGFSLSRLF